VFSRRLGNGQSEVITFPNKIKTNLSTINLEIIKHSFNFVAKIKIKVRK